MKIEEHVWQITLTAEKILSCESAHHNAKLEEEFGQVIVHVPDMVVGQLDEVVSIFLVQGALGFFARVVLRIVLKAPVLSYSPYSDSVSDSMNRARRIPLA
jgi:hypothetical protein